MKEFIEQIFLQSNFLLHTGADDAQFYINSTETNKRSFWLVIEQDKPDLLQNQSALFNKYRAIVAQQDFDKNCSLLLLIKSAERVADAEHKKEVLLIEDNPYYFKKYVLCYTEKEFTEFTVARNNRKELAFLEREMVSRACFEVYKKDPQAESWQSLIFRLALKIPFVNLKADVKPGLSALFDDNKEQLISKQLDALDDAVNGFLLGKTTDVIAKTAPMEILAALNLNKQQDGEQDPSDQDTEL